MQKSYQLKLAGAPAQAAKAHLHKFDQPSRPISAGLDRLTPAVAAVQTLLIKVEYMSRDWEFGSYENNVSGDLPYYYSDRRAGYDGNDDSDRIEDYERKMTVTE